MKSPSSPVKHFEAMEQKRREITRKIKITTINTFVKKTRDFSDLDPKRAGPRGSPLFSSRRSQIFKKYQLIGRKGNGLSFMRLFNHTEKQRVFRTQEKTKVDLISLLVRGIIELSIGKMFSWKLMIRKYKDTVLANMRFAYYYPLFGQDIEFRDLNNYINEDIFTENFFISNLTWLTTVQKNISTQFGFLYDLSEFQDIGIDRIDSCQPELNTTRSSFYDERGGVWLDWINLTQKFSIPLLTQKAIPSELSLIDLKCTHKEKSENVQPLYFIIWAATVLKDGGKNNDLALKMIKKELYRYIPNFQNMLDKVAEKSAYGLKQLYDIHLLWENKVTTRIAYLYTLTHITKGGDPRLYDFITHFIPSYDLSYLKYKVEFRDEASKVLLKLHRNLLYSPESLTDEIKRYFQRGIYLAVIRRDTSCRQRKKRKLFYRRRYQGSSYPITFEKLQKTKTILRLWFLLTDTLDEMKICAKELNIHHHRLNYFFDKPSAETESIEEIDIQKIISQEIRDRSLFNYLGFSKITPYDFSDSIVYSANYRVFQKDTYGFFRIYSNPVDLEEIPW